jgi:GLPGLI family protein
MYFLKNIFLFLLYLNVFQNEVTQQSDIYEVKYSFIWDESLSKLKHSDEEKNNLKNEFAKVNATLLFNNVQGKFWVDYVPNDNRDRYAVGVASKANTVYYFNHKTKKYIQTVSKTNGLEIIEQSDSLVWDIRDEFKEINGIKCQYAVASRFVKGFDNPSIFHVWFTEQYPVCYGPHGLYGLPGLILQSQYGANIFSARSIKKLNKTKVL